MTKNDVRAEEIRRNVDAEFERFKAATRRSAESPDAGRSSTAVEVRFFGGERIGEAAIQLVSAAADHGEAFGSFNGITLRAHRGTTATEIVEGFARETASTAAHTPGPWTVFSTPDGFQVVCCAGDYVVAHVRNKSDADAIAEVPEMFAEISWLAIGLRRLANQLKYVVLCGPVSESLLVNADRLDELIAKIETP